MLYSYKVARPVSAPLAEKKGSRQEGLVWALVWTLVGLGVFLRGYHYLLNRSLWVDEIYLITSIINLNFIDLATPPLAYEQKAPIGFMWLVKLSVVLFGKGELALRLVPLLAGVASLIVFLPVARFFLKPIGVLVAVGVLALAPPLVYHATEVKQYGMELLATVLVLYLYTRYHHKSDWASLLQWGGWGALIVWFSYSSIFILAGVALGVGLHLLLKRNWNLLLRSALPFTLWCLSFVLNYLLFTQKHADSEWLVSWFRVREGFFPVPFYSVAGAKWLFQSIYRTLDYPLGVLWNADSINALDSRFLQIFLKMPLFMFGFWALGLVMFFKRSRKIFFVLLFPYLLTLFATLIEMYPYYERLLVFLAPLPILYVAKGCERLTYFFSGRGKWRYVFPFIVLFWPLWSSAKQVASPHELGDYKYSYYRDALLHINKHYQQGDIVYVYWNIEHAYHYYKQAYNLKYDMVELTDKKHSANSKEEYLQLFEPELAQAAGKKRVWFIYERFLMLNIGDYDNDPAWYHEKGVKGGQAPLSKFANMGKEQEEARYIGDNVGVNLFILPEGQSPEEQTPTSQ